jgi:PAS domain S-box-containing protein
MRRASDTRLRAVTDSAQDPIMMMDPDGRISFWNPAAERLLGYTSAEALGQPLHELLVPPRYRAAFHAAFAAFRQTGQGAAVGATRDLEARAKDGRDIPVQLSLSAVHLQGSWHAVGILRDITERKQAMETIERQLADLETARAALEQDSVVSVELIADLIAEKDRSQEASKAKSEFLANMSHEIRTPMNGVIGMIGLLLDTDLSAEQRRYAQVVRASSEALMALINDILDFSKIEARKLELETLDFDLRATLEDTVELLAVKAHEKGLDLVCLIDPDIPVFLRGDPGRLRQVFLNLGGNAIKFTEKGGVTFRASLDAENERQVTVRVTVADTGIGITRDQREALFSRFTQVDGSATRKYGGTGLGLAICKELTALLGGTIGFESPSPSRGAGVGGPGSEFWFTAVFEKQPADRIHDPAPQADVAGARVLVVDDHDINRLLVTTLLEQWGCRVAEAAEGETALERLQQASREHDPYEVAVLDMLMSGMDGAELGRRIKENPDLCETRLIMMTSQGGRDDAARLAALGFAGFLTKPLRQSEFRECLAQVLGKGVPPTTMDAPAPRLITRHTMSEAAQRRARILLAEDNPTNQLVALMILEKLGYRADAVANGQEALSALRSIPYDLVLIDCQMPVMDGFEATRQIRNPRSAVRNHRVPVIAMTAHAIKGDRERCLDAGMDDYLTKPVRPADLAATLARWLTRVESARPALDSGPATEAGQRPASGDESRVFDRAGFVARVLGNEAVARVIANGYLADMPVQIEKLASAVAARNASLAAQHAHTIKGASANVSAEALRAAAAEMEQAGLAGDLTPLDALLPRLQQRFAQLRDAMEQAWSGRVRK